jgi:hypothetical protein
LLQVGRVDDALEETLADQEVLPQALSRLYVRFLEEPLHRRGSKLVAVHVDYLSRG